MSTGAAGSLLVALDRVSRDVRAILARVLDGAEVSVADADVLAVTTGRDLQALTLVADELRHRHVGDVVTYVVNRNINFTNVCIKHCGFCAFSRDHREEEGYLLPIDEVVRMPSACAVVMTSTHWSTLIRPRAMRSRIG